MNKYQEAFERVTNWFHAYKDKDGVLVQEQHITDNYKEKKEIIRELVDKATPRKVIITTEYYPNDMWRYVECPHCGDKLLGCYDNLDNELCNIYEMNYCPNCGQKLDWRDDNDNSNTTR